MKQWHAFHFKIDSFRALIIAGCANYNVCEIIVASRCGHRTPDAGSRRSQITQTDEENLSRMDAAMWRVCYCSVLFSVTFVFNKIITIITFFVNINLYIFAYFAYYECLLSYDPVVRIRNVAKIIFNIGSKYREETNDWIAAVFVFLSRKEADSLLLF